MCLCWSIGWNRSGRFATKQKIVQHKKKNKAIVAYIIPRHGKSSTLYKIYLNLEISVHSFSLQESESPLQLFFLCQSLGKVVLRLQADSISLSPSIEKRNIARVKKKMVSRNLLVPDDPIKAQFRSIPGLLNILLWRRKLRQTACIENNCEEDGDVNVLNFV